MKRDMDLCRKILFAIEERYVDVVLYNISIEGYSMEEVAYHCKILRDAKLISDYGAQYASNQIYSFGVGSLTWEGHEFLDKVREDTIWNKTKGVISSKLLPMTLDVVKDVATSIISAAVQGAIKGIQ